MAKIFFLPTCTNCGKILYSTYISCELNRQLVGEDPNNRVLVTNNYDIEPDHCPYCGDVFDEIYVSRPPFYCETQEFYKNHLRRKEY